MLNEILREDENAVIVLLSTKQGDNDDVILKNYNSYPTLNLQYLDFKKVAFYINSCSILYFSYLNIYNVKLFILCIK